MPMKFMIGYNIKFNRISVCCCVRHTSINVQSSVLNCFICCFVGLLLFRVLIQIRGSEAWCQTEELAL